MGLSGIFGPLKPFLLLVTKQKGILMSLCSVSCATTVSHFQAFLWQKCPFLECFLLQYLLSETVFFSSCCCVTFHWRMPWWRGLQSGPVSGESTSSVCLSVEKGPVCLEADFHLLMDLTETTVTPIPLCHLEPGLQKCNWNISSGSCGALAAEVDSGSTHLCLVEKPFPPRGCLFQKLDR